MIPTHQTNTTPENGDCFSACIASLLEIPLEDVPVFCAQENENIKEWPINAHEWFGEKGIGWIELDCREMDDCLAINNMKVRGGYTIVTGQSPRHECLHSVIYKDGEFVHDPHPEGGGVEDIQFVEYLAPHDPSVLTTKRKEE